MLQEDISTELKRAQADQLEVDILLEGGTAYPRLVVDQIGNGTVTFRDSEASKITIASETIRGAAVGVEPPKWLSAHGYFSEHHSIQDRSRL